MLEWPYPPEWIVRFLLEDASYVVDVEIALEEGGKTYLTGIAVRSGVPTSPAGTPQDPWLEGAEYEPVVPRDVQRLPLTRYVRAALAIVTDPLTEEGRREVGASSFPGVAPRADAEPSSTGTCWQRPVAWRSRASPQSPRSREGRR
jgi:hypothetical protein